MTSSFNPQYENGILYATTSKIMHHAWNDFKILCFNFRMEMDILISEINERQKQVSTVFMFMSFGMTLCVCVCVCVCMCVCACVCVRAWRKEQNHINYEKSIGIINYVTLPNIGAQWPVSKTIPWTSLQCKQSHPLTGTILYHTHTCTMTQL